ncbi:hypothetical protein WCX18_09565 [Sulfurimonas sp. HSL1-2]|uniref:hypothetical protein n=1 Tax=Thiomicrolovo zhangzhouensis TaxID=3131933 RepID=UPI0031F8CD3A
MSFRGKALCLLVAVSTLSGYELTVESSSRQVFQGEPLRLVYRFAHAASDKGIDFRFAAPELAHFQVLQSHAEERHEAGAEVWEKSYIIVPMQGGELSTGTAAMNVAERTYTKDAWGQWMPSVAWQQHLFEPITLFAHPVPGGVQAVGAFRLEAVIDRNATERGQPVHLTLSLSGCGNLETAEPLRMAIAGVSVFDEGHTENAAWRDGCYSNEVNRTFALVGERDFTVPSVSFRSFDPATQRVVTASSLPIPVHVRAETEPKVKRTNTKEETMTIWSLAAGVAAGFVLGVAATLLLMRRKEKETRVRVDSLRAALVALFGHLDDPEAKKSAEAVEKHLYEGADAPDDKEIATLLGRLKRGEQRAH